MPKSIYVDPEQMLRPGKIHFEDIPVNQYSKTLADERASFTDEELKSIFEYMYTIRVFEEMVQEIKTQGQYDNQKHSFVDGAHLSIGQEAASVGMAWNLDTNDILVGTHRGHADVIAKALVAIRKLSDEQLTTIMEEFCEGKMLGAIRKGTPADSVKETATEFFLYGMMTELFARDYSVLRGLGGSKHAAFAPFGIFPCNAIVGGSAPIATGAALFKRINQKPGVVVASLGDGSLGTGPVWESINFAAMDQCNQLWEEGHNGGLPIVYHFNNNHYGMGGQTKGETMAYDELARFGAGVRPDQLHAERINGYNPLAVIDAYRRKLPLLREGKGPILLDVVTYRLLGHSCADVCPYRTEDESAAWRKYDAMVHFPEALIEAGVATAEEIDQIRAKVLARNKKVFHLAADKEISPYVDFDAQPHFIEDLMFSNQYKRKMADEKPDVLGPKEDNTRVKQIAAKSRFAFDAEGKPVPKLKLYNIRDGIFEAVFDKFYEDPTFISYGEDIREWGGAFAVYRNMYESIPKYRLFNSPISESAIIGSATGYGMSGGRACVELMYCDFLARCGDELFNQLAKWQSMSGGAFKMPIVVRISVGALYGAQHSQDWTSLCAHIPGLKCVFPVTPYDAKGLMNSALAGTDPVLFFESQRIYDKGEEFHEGGVPEGYYEIPLGEPDIKRAGKDITILTIGAPLYRAMDAARVLEEKYGVSAEIIDARSLVPFNYDAVVKSVEKTGKILLVSDACTRGSFMNDIANNIGQLCFDYLDAAPMVIGSENWIAPAFEYDEVYSPQVSHILDAIHTKLLPLEGHICKHDYSKAELMRKASKGV